MQVDAAKPIQLRWAMPGATPEQLESVLAKLQTMGVNASVTMQPATVQEIRQMCDRICKLAESIAEHSDDEDELGFVLDALSALRKQMQPSTLTHQLAMRILFWQLSHRIFAITNNTPAMHDAVVSAPIKPTQCGRACLDHRHRRVSALREVAMRLEHEGDGEGRPLRARRNYGTMCAVYEFVCKRCESRALANANRPSKRGHGDGGKRE